MAKRSPNDPCPCDSGDKYKRCCGPLHRGAPATTAERLMRSRFSAYAVGDVEYIVATTHPGGPHFGFDPFAWRAGIADFCGETEFVGLRILDRGELTGGGAFVTFRAALVQNLRDASFAERSQFRRLDGAWKYFDGEPA